MDATNFLVRCYASSAPIKRGINPYVPSNRNTSIEKWFKKHEQEKKRAYEQRILDVEHAFFTPLVFSASGGLAKEATTFYK